MTLQDQYLKFVQWEEAEGVYVGYCPDLFPWGGVSRAPCVTRSPRRTRVTRSLPSMRSVRVEGREPLICATIRSPSTRVVRR